MSVNQYDPNNEQAADEAAAWLDDCKMLRQPQNGDDSFNRVVVFHKGRVVGDFFQWQGSDGIMRENADGVVSLVGERPSFESLKGQGFLTQRTVRFNTLTNQVERVATPARSRK